MDDVDLIPVIFPASPREAWDMLQVMFQRARGDINDLPEEYRMQRWHHEMSVPGPIFSPLESPGCYVGYCVGCVLQGFFGLPIDWIGAIKHDT